MSMSEIIVKDARLRILETLNEEPDRRSNSERLREELSLRFAITRPREWVNQELRFLEQMSAVSIVQYGDVLIASLREKGLDHVEGRLAIEGVKRPSLA